MLQNRSIHFIGIGGIRHERIAEIFSTLATPSQDRICRRTGITERLTSLGATVFEGHAAAKWSVLGVVVTRFASTSAIPK